MTYEEWEEANEDELWISYHESGACYDTEYEDYCDYKYERSKHEDNNL